MNETIRELIIEEFITRAAVIVTTGSPQAYATDIGSNVLRARSQVDPGELPCINVVPETEESENMYGRCRAKMTIRAEGIMLFGALSPSLIAERILGDLKKAFTDPDWDRRRLVTSPASPVTYLDPYAESIVYQGGGTESVLADGSVSVGAVARFLVTYWTAVGDPWSQ
jgi:hypothetical protein